MSRNLRLLILTFIFQIFIMARVYGDTQRGTAKAASTKQEKEYIQIYANSLKNTKQSSGGSRTNKNVAKKTQFCRFVVQRSRPVIPLPRDVIYKEIKPKPYTRLIQSKRYGKFYFTAEAEKDFGEYNRLCKILGIRKEITESVKVSLINKDQLQIQWVTPSGDLKEALVNLKTTSSPEAYIIDYPHEDYIIKVIIDPQKKHEVLLVECIAKYSMEIPMVALVNKKQEIEGLILPPEENVLLLNIDRDLVREYNRDNISLMKDLNNPMLKADQKDDIIQHFIANAIYHPLGKLSLGIEAKAVVIVAEVATQRILIPLECLSIPLNGLIQENTLKKYFPEEEVYNLSDSRILKLIHKRTEEFSLRKDWYIITTPNTCFWTDYFMNYIENQVKLFKQDINVHIPIHLHPWYSLQWLLDDPFGKYWLTQYCIHLIPSGKDIEFFKGRYPEGRLYIILSKDIYSSELNWAIYDDLAGVEAGLSEFNRFEKDYKGGPLTEKDIKKIQDILIGLVKSQATISRYHTEEREKLVIEPNIDSLLEINGRQLSILSLIDDYRKDYPWRLTNFRLIVPLLNKHLASYGWKAISTKEKLGSDITKKQFCYSPALNTRMDLVLFIIFELCYINSEDMHIGVKREKELIGFLKDITHQLDYLAIKYHHFKEFREHIRYLSYIIRYYIWEWEKAVLIAQEQLQNGRRTLDRYNLGYYPMVSSDNLKIIAGTSIDVTSKRIIELESLIKELSKTHSIKNEEEFVLEFEKRLILGILKHL